MMVGMLDVKAPSTCDGIWNICKPIGWTSHDVVGRLRRVLGFQKVGHAGTLDPAATGVLPILLGKGTRISDYLMSWDKEYEGVLRLGQDTDTQDATGTVIMESCAANVTEDAIREVMGRFQGEIQQVPPMFSAVKVNGLPLYKAARAGKVVNREARTVTIHRLDILKIYEQDVSFRVVCSKGTYIRTLCADIGQQLGVGGHLRSLQRVRVGPLHMSHALSPQDIEPQVNPSQGIHSFLSLDEALNSMPVVMVDSSVVSRVLNGCAIPFSTVTQQEVAYGDPKQLDLIFRVKDPLGRLLGLGRCASQSGALPASDSQLVMIKVLAEPSLSASY